jgi:acetyl esterase
VTLDPRIQAILAALPARASSQGTPAERRAAARTSAGEMPPLRHPAAPMLDERDAVAPGVFGGVPVRIYRPKEGVLPALIWIHGGGWWTGELGDSDELCRRRATTTGCVVVAVDYRLAPEHPFPAGLDDCWAATRWVFASAHELGIDAQRIAISGGSAGGNLAAAVTLKARDSGEVHLVAQVLEIPATDLTLSASRRSAEEFADGYMLTRADLIESAEFYLSGHDPSDRLASPLMAELHELPPALVLTCECDPVRDDGEAYAAKLEAAGVPVKLVRWEGMVHGSAELSAIVPEIAERYTDEIAQFLQTAFEAQSRCSTVVKGRPGPGSPG